MVELVPRERGQQPTVEETVEVGRLVLYERVQQRSAEKEILEVFENFHQERISERTQSFNVPVPQVLEEVLQQRAAEQTEDLPRSPQNITEILMPMPQDKNVLPKRVSGRIFEQGGVIEVPETASQDRRLQRTVVQYLDVFSEVDKNVLRERISERMRDQINREHLQCYFKLRGRSVFVVA